MVRLKSKYTLLLFVAILVALLSVASSIQPVLAGGATVLQVDVSFLGPPPNHPCTGGTLEASGMITVVMHPTDQGYFLHTGSGPGG